MADTNVILHIEDDAGLAAAVGMGLKEAGFKVVRAMNAEEGLRKARLVRPNMILLDLGMPGMSGVMVLRQLKASPDLSKLPVLVFTAHAGMLAADLRQYAAGVLLKPVGIDTLVAEVRRVMYGNAAPSDEAEPSAGANEAAPAEPSAEG